LSGMDVSLLPKEVERFKKRGKWIKQASYQSYEVHLM
jgi:hypothetical protein